MPVTIRPATPADLGAITELYNSAGVGSTASYDLEPASLGQRAAWLDAHDAAGFPVLVAEVDGAFAGYGAYGRFREKAGYDAAVEHSVYVVDGRRGLGVGRALVGALVGVARAQGVHVMVGVLDADNAESRAFHARLGFEEAGRLRQVGRKFDRWLDILFVELILD